MSLGCCSLHRGRRAAPRSNNSACDHRRGAPLAGPARSSLLGLRAAYWSSTAPRQPALPIVIRRRFVGMFAARSSPRIERLEPLNRLPAPWPTGALGAPVLGGRGSSAEEVQHDRALAVEAVGRDVNYGLHRRLSHTGRREGDGSTGGGRVKCATHFAVETRLVRGRG